MPIKLGSGGISKLYVGSTAITRAYVGETLVFDSAPIEPFVVLDPYWSATDDTSYTAVGNVTGSGLVVIALGYRGQSGTSAAPDSVTASGVAATQRVFRNQSNNVSSAIYTAEVAGPGDIVVNFSPGAVFMNIQAFLAQDFDPVPHDTGSDGVTNSGEASFTIDVEAGGFIIGACAWQSAANNTIGASMAHRQFVSAAAGHTVGRANTTSATWTGLDSDTNESEAMSIAAHRTNVVAASFSPL